MPDAPKRSGRGTRHLTFLPRNYCIVLALGERITNKRGAASRFNVTDVVHELFEVSEAMYGPGGSPLMMSPTTVYRALTALEERDYLLRDRDDPAGDGLDTFWLTDAGRARAEIELTTLAGRKNAPVPALPRLLIALLSGEPVPKVPDSLRR